MTSLERYEFVLVAGPRGVNRVSLLRTATPAPSPDPDASPALPLRLPFRPPPAARPSGWADRYHTVLPPGRSVRQCQGQGQSPTGVPEGWCPPDGPALRALREAAGLSQRAAARVGALQRGILSDLERGTRRMGKGISAAMLYHYVTALEATSGARR